MAGGVPGGGMHGRGRCGRGACMAGGMNGGGGCAWLGACMAGGMCAWQERQALKRMVRILLECILVVKRVITEQKMGCGQYGLFHK